MTRTTIPLLLFSLFSLVFVLLTDLGPVLDNHLYLPILQH
jgi:hypothetical protein